MALVGVPSPTESDGAMPQRAQALDQANGHRGLALTQRCGRDRGDVHVLADGVGSDATQRVEMHLGFGVAIGDELLLLETDLRGDLIDRLQSCAAGDGEIAGHGRGWAQAPLPGVEDRVFLPSSTREGLAGAVTATDPVLRDRRSRYREGRRRE